MCAARAGAGAGAGAHRCITEGASRTPDVREAGSREGEGEGGRDACMHRVYGCIYALAGLCRREVRILLIVHGCVCIDVFTYPFFFLSSSLRSLPV